MRDNPNLTVNEDTAPTRAQMEGWIRQAVATAKGKSRSERQKEVRLAIITRLASLALPTPVLDAILTDLASYTTYEQTDRRVSREV